MFRYYREFVYSVLCLCLCCLLLLFSVGTRCFFFFFISFLFGFDLFSRLHRPIRPIDRNVIVNYPDFQYVRACTLFNKIPFQIRSPAQHTDDVRCRVIIMLRVLVSVCVCVLRTWHSQFIKLNDFGILTIPLFELSAHSRNSSHKIRLSCVCVDV